MGITRSRGTKPFLCLTLLALASCGGGGGGVNTLNPEPSPATPPAVPAPALTPAPGSDLTSCKLIIPPEQPAEVRREGTPYPSPPLGYPEAIGWANITIATGGSGGKATFQNLILWERKDGATTVIARKIFCPLCDPNDRVFGYSLPKSQWPVASAWSRPNEGGKFVLQDTTVIVPAANLPADVYHFWNADWPRPVGSYTSQYFVTADVIIEGAAMVQIGLDFWKSKDDSDQRDASRQAAYSSWYCASPGVQTIRAGAYP